MSEEKVSLTKNQPVPGDRNYIPPAAVVPLPSKGLIYPTNSSLANKDKVEINAMTAREEDILTSSALLKQGTVLDVLLKSCIADRSINVDQMIGGDRNAILTAIRITGYGQEYEIEVQCPSCETKVKHKFDLSQLKIKPLGVEPRVANTNEFVFTLPVSGSTVIFKLLTGADERELSTVISRSRKIAGNDGLVTARLIRQIISINGETDGNKLASMIKAMPARDSKEFRKYADLIAPGVDMTQNFVCPSCNEEVEVDVPMTTEFFWPST